MKKHSGHACIFSNEAFGRTVDAFGLFRDRSLIMEKGEGVIFFPYKKG